MKTLLDYTVVITPNASAFLAYVPAIEGCHALGATPDEARSELDGVFEMIAEEFAERTEPLPDDIPSEQLLALG